MALWLFPQLWGGLRLLGFKGVRGEYMHESVFNMILQ